MTSATGAASRTAIYRDVVREVSVNVATAVPAVRRLRLSRPRNSSSFGGSMGLLDRYASDVFRGLERLVGPVRGRSAVEFGPGDHLATGLFTLAAGASRYTAIDRFVPDYSSPPAKRWYGGLHAASAERFPDHPWPQDLDPDDFPESYRHRVTTFSEGVEGHDLGHADATYDLVTSWPLGEQARDIPSFAKLTARLLAPRGVAVHRVDFGPHDCCRRYQNPLTVLQFAPTLWQAMSSTRGSPNRRRHHEFLAALSANGLVVTCRDAGCLDPGAVDLTKVDASFQRMPPDSLAVRDVIYVRRSSSGRDR